MAAELVEIADAVVSDLNDHLSGWGFDEVATRRYAPSFKKEELSNPAFTVLINATTQAYKTRGLNTYSPNVIVDIRQSTDGDDTKNDAIMAVAERIADHFMGDGSTLTAYTTAKADCVQAETSPAFQTEDLVSKQIFAAAVSLTFQVVRAAK